jgi:hypothetical protein
MSNIVSDLFRDLERKWEVRRAARQAVELTRSGKPVSATPIRPSRRPMTTEPYRPVSDHQLRISHL